MARAKVRDTTHVVTLRLSTGDYYLLKAMSLVTGCSMNQAVVHMIDDSLHEAYDDASRKRVLEVVQGWKDQAARKEAQ